MLDVLFVREQDFSRQLEIFHYTVKTTKSLFSSVAIKSLTKIKFLKIDGHRTNLNIYISILAGAINLREQLLKIIIFQQKYLAFLIKKLYHNIQNFATHLIKYFSGTVLKIPKFKIYLRSPAIFPFFR